MLAKSDEKSLGIVLSAQLCTNTLSVFLHHHHFNLQCLRYLLIRASHELQYFSFSLAERLRGKQFALLFHLLNSLIHQRGENPTTHIRYFPKLVKRKVRLVFPGLLLLKGQYAKIAAIMLD